MAAGVGNRAITKLLLEQGADVSAATQQGITALHMAAIRGKGDEKVSKLLISKGVDTHATASGGFTALHFAAATGKIELVKLLIAAGADAKAVTQNGNLTPLDLALGESGDDENSELVSFLKKHSIE